MRELPYKLTSGLRRVVASLTGMAAGATLLAALGLAGKPAQAQTPPEPPKQPASNAQVIPQDNQSQKNPFPNGWGSAQNRGWSPDPYWGMLDANVPWGIPNGTIGGFPTLFQPMSRVPDNGVTPQLLELDGWGFPRGASLFGAFLTRASVSFDPSASGFGTPGQPNPAAPVTGFAGQWAPVQNGQPSTITSGATQYYRSLAQTRLNVAPQAVPPAQRFVYDMRTIAYNGANNSQERFQVRVSIPSPNPTAGTGLPENRVTDARYVVYYYIRLSDGSYAGRRKVYTISQAGGGEEVLTNANGNPAFFPFFIRQAAATFGNGANGTPNLPAQDDLGVPFQGVIVDNTTGNTGESLYVLAETLQLVPSVDQVAATPTITPPHGGRRVASADPTGATYTQYPSGSQPYQPMVGPNYLSDQTGTTVGAFVNTNSATNERYNNSSDFINDPFDPRYNPNSPNYDPQRVYESWNPSTVFRGPESLIDPRLLRGALPAYPFPFGNLPGERVGPGTNNRVQVPVTNPLTGQTELQANGQPFTRVASSVDSNNQDIYRRNRYAAYQPDPTAQNYNPAVPYYSQTQVIVARTEYVLDPEDGIPDSEKDGTLTLQVGAVFGLDWQTGTPIWRFPDRSYAESRTSNGGYRTNYRNQFVPANPTATLTATDDFAQAARNPLNPNLPLYQVPGIRAVDKNLDGVISDDEVFIVGQGGNSNGGVFASVTMAPRVKVRGNVRLPLYRTQVDPTTGRTFTFIRHADEADVTGDHYAQTSILQPGRYAGRTAPFDPVEVGVIYVAAANGVVYALDAYGNNDNDYVPNLPSPIVATQPDYRTFGTYRAGTTNVLWTFSAVNSRQGDTDRNGTINLPTETTAAYNARLKKEIPGTGSFNQSAPVLAFQRDGGDFTQTTTDANGNVTLSHPFNWQGEEQRLFVGNGNGVLYAMDSAADAGRTFDTTGAPVGVQNLPFRKESYQPSIGYNPPTDPIFPNTYVFGPLGLKWWFQTFSGGINAAPAVSVMRQDAGTYNSGALNPMETQGLDPNRAGRKGVFFTSLEGRVYALDWSGPVTKIARNVPLSLASGTGENGANGSTQFDDPSVLGRNTFAATPPAAAFTGYGNVPSTLAEALNDGWYFHNIRPTATNGLPDQKEGTVRPRWTYPNLYQDIDVTDNNRSQVVDNAVSNGLTNPANETIAGIRLLDGSTSIGQITSPPVLIDFPYQTPSGKTRYRSYLAFQAPDYTTDPSPTQSRLYLLDQIGDRANFLTNPRVRGTTTATRRVVSQPRDRWSPGVVLAESAPAWSYRMVYDRLNTGGTTTANIDIARRNSPLYIAANRDDNFTPVTSADLSTNNLTGPKNVAIPGRRVLPTLYIGGIGRVYSIDFDIETGLFMRWRPGSPTSDTAQIASLTATGAFTPMPNLAGIANDQDYAPGAEAAENRLNPVDYTFAQVNRPGLAYSQVLVRVTPFVGPVAQVTHITITGGPNQNRSAAVAVSGNTTLTDPTVPGFPTDNVPYLGLPYLSLLQAITSTQLSDITRYDFGDLYDTAAPDAPQRGVARKVNQEINDPLTTSEGYRASLVARPNTNPVLRVPNTAYQFPMLFVTDIEGYLHALSSNTEGEDYDSDTANGVQHTVGWAVLGFSDQVAEPISARHTLQFTQQGPGGLSGVAVLTNAYWPALDPTFTNTARVTANPTDPYRFYPNGEPNTVSPTPYRVNDVAGLRVSPATVIEPVANNDDPRPAFRPRSLSPGQAAVTDGNGNVVTPETLADWHTGQTGFPLDLNGLFFDKRFAGRYGFTPSIAGDTEAGTADPLNALDTRTTDPITGQTLIEPLQANPQHPNGDYRVRLRLPGYDYIGGLLLTPGTGNPTGRRDTNIATNPLGNLFEEMVVTANPNNQVPNGARVQRDATTGTATGNITSDNDDINPAAQNVAWIYAGGQNGLTYAYTPALPGQASGFSAGTPTNGGPYPPGEGDQPLIAIVSRNFFESVILPRRTSGTQLPSTFPQDVLAASVARNGGKNFYEWGESVYIVVYNLAGRTRQNVTTPGQVFVSPTRRITLDFIAENVNTTSGRVVIQQERQTGTQNLITYPATDQPDASPVGIAVYEYRLTGNPSSTLPQTPGANIRISATPDPAQRLGRQFGSAPPVTDPTGLGTASDIYFTIANPLAVQGVLVNTTDGVPLLAAGRKSDQLQNGIGPFAAAADDTVAPKNQVAGQVNGQVATGTDDPDAIDARYAQALTNGNYIIRRNLRRFNGTGIAARPNPGFNNILTDANRTPEPTYYMPVMASAYYIGHGSSGSTDIGANQQNLRILNRSLLSALGSVRVDSVSSFLFRSWPGRVPNAVGDIVEPFSNTVVQDNSNPRYTPPGMDVFGRINPLPWEAIGADVRPWAADSPVNNNPDYTDIIASSRTVRVAGPGGDFSAGNGTLTAGISAGANQTVASGAVTVGQGGIPVNPLPAALSLNATVTVPKYQAANLVANHSLTSTFVAPSSADSRDGSGNSGIVLQNNEGPVQLPRGSGSGIPRALQRADNGQQGITPFGYTAAMRVFAGNAGTNTRGNTSAIVQLQNSVTGLSSQASNRTITSFSTGAYRDFEIDFGVPVDMRLEVAGKGTDVIDLGILGHSFGVDNGLLGYGLNGLYAPGILPPPLVDLTTFGGSVPYDRFFKAFTARNEGNVNLYNIRASQRSQVIVNNSGTATVAGYRWFGLQSQNVDARYAIGAVGADVLGSINNQLPQVITSLDPRYDAAWDQYFQTRPELATPIDANTASPYALYYQQFAGRHTLHKARTGATRGAVLSVPDVPGAINLRPDRSEINVIQDPRVGAAIPIGTPSAVYATPEVRSGDDRTARAILGQSLVLFEDHDAGPNNIYQAVPQWNGNGISPAGPLYAGQNIRHPGTAAIAGEDNLSSLYSLWRVRGINGSVPQYQPYTERGLPLRVTVSESPLTGDVPDRSLANGALGPIIASGRLPGIDPFPLVDRTTNLLRPAQSLTPAAFRGPDGSLNVYFTRNADVADNGTPNLNSPFAQPGSRYTLFFTHLQWNAALGTWQPQNPGAPLSGVPFANGGDYTGGAKWFSTPIPLRLGTGTAAQSNTSPFILDTRVINPQGGASLFWVNEEPIASGRTYGQVYVSALGANGQPTGTPTPFLANYDPTVQRFSPRAVYAPFATQGGAQVNASQTIVFYYGGTGGRYGLYYSIRGADANGFPVGNAPDAAERGQNREILLPTPASLAGASDPMPVYRFLQVPVINNQGQYAGVRPAWVVDVYFTGLSRTNQVPSVYMSRYELVRQGGNRFTLQPLTLPRVRYEALASSAREPVYSARHIGWQNNTARRLDLPVIRVGADPVTATVITNPTRWRVDAGTGLLYQGYTRTINGTQTQNVVYVDAAAGIVRFRGTGIPRRSENVYADYQPSSYRMTPDGQANQGAFAFYDTRPIAETLRTANQPTTGNVLRRRQPMATPYVGIGRQWLIWQKGANAERGGALVHSVRRVGADLKAVSTITGRMAESDSIRLSAVDENGVAQGQNNYTANQTPMVEQVTIFALDDLGNRTNVVTGTPTSGIPYEVDVAKGRVYVEPQYEGMFIEVRYYPLSGEATNAVVTAESALTPIEELAETSTQPREVLIPLRRVVNEIQPYAFLDTFDPTGGQYDPATGVVNGVGAISGRSASNGDVVPRVVATNPLNGRQEFADPSLQPGRIWLFWSSPRGRQGTATANGIDLFPGGYDLYWQTLAPEFEPYLSPLLPAVPGP